MEGLPHRARGLRVSKGRGNAVIAHDGTVRDRCRHLEHLVLEGAVYEARIDGPGEALTRPRKVGLSLAQERLHCRLIFLYFAPLLGCKAGEEASGFLLPGHQGHPPS